MEAAADQLSAASWSRTRGRSENHLPQVAQETGTAITQTQLLQASGSSDFHIKGTKPSNSYSSVCVGCGGGGGGGGAERGGEDGG